jgi:hypothetical protein
MKNRMIGALGMACMVGMAAAVVAQTVPAASTRPAALATTQAATAPARRATPITITGRADPRAPGYIVLFDGTVDAKAEVARLEKLYNFKARYTYDMGPGFKGFAATLSADAVEKLRWEPTVKSIEHDGSVSVVRGSCQRHEIV